jgi:hypothetical protein
MLALPVLMVLVMVLLLAMSPFVFHLLEGELV